MSLCNRARLPMHCLSYLISCALSALYSDIYVSVVSSVKMVFYLLRVAQEDGAKMEGEWHGSYVLASINPIHLPCMQNWCTMDSTHSSDNDKSVVHVNVEQCTSCGSYTYRKRSITCSLNPSGSQPNLFALHRYLTTTSICQ